MAVSIANLAVRLSANTAAFASGFSRAAKQVKAFSTDAVARISKVTSIIGALTVAATGGGLSILVKNQMEVIDQMAKLSDRTGIATETLAGLTHGAGLAGVEQENLFAALEKMQKILGDSVIKGGEAAKAFDAFGLSAAELAKMPAADAIGVIADKYRELTNPAERAALATLAFGKAGQAMGSFLMTGSEGIAAMQADAELLGLTFSRIDAAKVEAANDAMTRMWSVFTGIGRTLAIELAPFITAAADSFTNLATSGGGAGDKIVTAVEWIATAVAKAADWVDLLKSGFYFFKAGAITAMAGVIKAVDLLGQGIVYLLNLLPGVEMEWTDTFSLMTDSLVEQALEAGEKGKEAFDSFADGANSAKVSQFFDDIRAKATENAVAVASAADAMNGYTDSLATAGEEGEDVFGKLDDSFQKLNDAANDERVKQFDKEKEDAEKRQQELDRLFAESDGKRSEIVFANSAKAQQERFAGAMGIRRMNNSTQEKQLEEQQQSNDYLADIVENTSNAVELVEVDF